MGQLHKANKAGLAAVIWLAGKQITCEELISGTPKLANVYNADM